MTNLLGYFHIGPFYASTDQVTFKTSMVVKPYRPYPNYISIPYIDRVRRVMGISGSLIWSKTLMDLIFNPCGEFRRSPEVPVSQIHSPHLQVGAPGIFSDLLRSILMVKREWGAEGDRKLPHLFNPW